MVFCELKGICKHLADKLLSYSMIYNMTINDFDFIILKISISSEGNTFLATCLLPFNVMYDWCLSSLPSSL